MVIDVIIGNPPYQENTTSIYQKFIQMALEITYRICMITRNNWLVSYTLGKDRYDMIHSGLVEVINYDINGDIFSGSNVAVAIFLIDYKGYRGKTHYSRVAHGEQIDTYDFVGDTLPVIFTHSYEYSIYNKIFNNDIFSINVLPCEPFRINSNGLIDQDNFDRYIEVRERADEEYNTKIAFMNKDGSLRISYMRLSDVPLRVELVPEYKVICGGRLNNNTNVITNINILDKGSICSASYAVIYHSDNRENVEKAYKYIKTKFFRYLARVLCDSGMTNISSYRFSLIPNQDFNNTDINWELGIDEIDRQLYKKYALSDDEIEHIEKLDRSD